MRIDPRPSKIARTDLRKDMAEFVSKIYALPYTPLERKVFDSLSQCEHLLFDPSIKQAFLLPLFHFLQKSSLSIQIPLGASSSSSSSYGGGGGGVPKGDYKYWVLCNEGADAIEAMKKQKNSDGEPLYSSEAISRLVERFGKVWWKVQKTEYEDIQAALSSKQSEGLPRVASVFIRSIAKKVIKDKFTNEDITMLVPSLLLNL